MKPVQVIRRATCAAVLGSSLWVAAGAVSTTHAAAPRVSVYAVLAGTWLGPGLGDTGGCGQEYGQFTFFRNGEYAYTSNSEDCGGFTNAGYYRIRNGVIILHWVECNFPCAPGTASAAFAFLGPDAFEVADAGGTYVYYRQ